MAAEGSDTNRSGPAPFADIKRGVRQGCVLSPYLFNIYTEFIFRDSNDLEGITINGHNINNLRYADDTALIAKSESKLQAIVNCVKERSSQAGLDMNVNKTKTMMISRNPIGKAIKVEVSGTTLEQVDQFKYLGTQITVDAKSETEVKSRINLAKAKFGMMAKVLTSRNLSIPLKIRMTNCYVFSILMYGAEAWTLTKPLEKNIEAFEMWCMRRIARISWKEKVTNKEVLERLNTNRQLLQTVKQRKLRYFGHIRRKGDIIQTILEGRMEGRRPRGRPRQTWFGNIPQWTGRDAQRCIAEATDRHLWSVITRQPLDRR